MIISIAHALAMPLMVAVVGAPIIATTTRSTATYCLYVALILGGSTCKEAKHSRQCLRRDGGGICSLGFEYAQVCEAQASQDRCTAAVCSGVAVGCAQLHRPRLLFCVHVMPPLLRASFT